MLEPRILRFFLPGNSLLALSSTEILCRSQSKDAERCFFVGVICVSFFDLTFSQIISSESSARDTQKKKKKKTDCTNISQRAVLGYHRHTILTLALIKGSQTFHFLRKLHVQFLSLICLNLLFDGV